MWPRFGIKVGNSTLCIAQVRQDGKAEVIANKQGDRVSQACLLWDGDSEIECGLTAKQKMANRPEQAVANSFQLLQPNHLSEDQVAAATREIPCEYDAENHVFRLKHTEHNDGGDSPKIAKRDLNAYNVHVHLFRSELELARQYHIDTDQKPIVVLSIPTYYPKSAWSLLAQAADEAGFHVAQVVAEPTAAVLAYSIGEVESPMSTPKYVLTIKSGGLYSHFALYMVHDGFYTQLETNGPFPIGGRHYTEALVQFICEEFQRKYRLDPHESRRSIAKIRTAAANCKHILTTLPSTQLYIDSLMDGVDFNAQMSRARFESLIQPVMNTFMQTLGESVERSLQRHPQIKGIDSIVLLGATMQIPKLQAAIAARFPDAQLHCALSADEVVAIGCARQAVYLANPQGQDLHATDECVCAEQELLIWHGDDETHAQVIISKGMLLPRTVQLDIKLSMGAITANEDDDSNGYNSIGGNVFRLRCGEKVDEVSLTGTMPQDGCSVVRIEAHIGCSKDDAAAVPLIRLRCV